MPYTKEELKNNTFYQNLLDEDEQQYLAELYDDETSTLYATTVVEQLKDDDTINQIIDRDIREL